MAPVRVVLQTCCCTFAAGFVGKSNCMEVPIRCKCVCVEMLLNDQQALSNESCMLDQQVSSNESCMLELLSLLQMQCQALLTTQSPQQKLPMRSVLSLLSKANFFSHMWPYKIQGNPKCRVKNLMKKRNGLTQLS